MAKFIYRMQSILDIKEKLEEQARQEFAQANRRLLEENEKLESLQRRKEQYEQKGRELLTDSLKVTDILENEEAIVRIQEFIAYQQDAVAKAEELVEEARERLTQARQESKMHQRLKEKAFESFTEEMKSAETKEVDELTSYVYGQNSGE